MGRHSERSAELRVTRAPLTHNGARHCWTEAVPVGTRAREAKGGGGPVSGVDVTSSVCMTGCTVRRAK